MSAMVRVSLSAGGWHDAAVRGDWMPSAGELCVIDRNGFLSLGRVQGLRSGEAPPEGAEATVLRAATADDRERQRRGEALAAEALDACAAEAARLGIALKPLAARCALDRSALEITIGAGCAADARPLALALQRRFGLRIELRQVGVRDETALLGGLGPCGRHCCCASWQRQFRSVNVRMAKTQELSLNPASINGNCGRLKCCLRFEVEAYREAAQSLPREGACVVWAEGEGVVVGRDVLRGRLVVRPRDGRQLRLAAEQVTVKEQPPDLPAEEVKLEERDADPGDQWTEPEAAGEA